MGKSRLIIKQYCECKKESCNYYYKKKIIKLIIIIRITFSNIFKLIRILLNKYSYIRQIEFVLTTRCTLRCKDCANLMQHYDKTYDVDLECLKKSIEKVLDEIDETDKLILLGGEPFLYPHLNELLSWLYTKNKYNSIHFYTNATLIPSNEVIESLKNDKVFVVVSDYGVNSYRLTELCNLFDRENINYRIKKEDNHWLDGGDFTAFKGRNEEQLSNQFKNCNLLCRSVLNGKLYYCPRASHMNDLGIIFSENDEYVDLLDDSVSAKDILAVIYRERYQTACNYCNYGTDKAVVIEPGIQKTKGLN